MLQAVLPSTQYFFSAEQTDTRRLREPQTSLRSVTRHPFSSAECSYCASVPRASCGTVLQSALFQSAPIEKPEKNVIYIRPLRVLSVTECDYYIQDTCLALNFILKVKTLLDLLT